MSESPPSTDALSDSRSATSGGAGAERVDTRARLVAVAVGAALVVVALLASVLAAIPVVLFTADLTSPGFLVTSLVATQLAFLAVGLAYVGWRLGTDALGLRLPTRREAGWIGGATLAALAVAALTTALGGVLGVEPTRSVLEPYIVADPTVLLVLGALSVVLVAPAEELLFRGAIQTRIGRAFGPVLTVGLSSLLFASIHVFNFVGGSTGVLFATGTIFAVGVVLGTAYERTGNLAVPVLVHGVYNAVLFVTAYVTTVGI
jgi:hypothetical protein